MKNKIVVLLLCLIAFKLAAQESKSKFKEAFKSSLVVITDVSYELSSEKLQKSELIIKPEFSYKLNKNSKLVFKGQIYSEFHDHLEAGIPREETVSKFSKRWFIGDRTNLELREFYYYTKIYKKIRLTLGKQQIVWGETDGLKLLDVVNPQNFREFILDDFEDSRIPLWSLKAEFEIKNIGVQLLWIPDNTYHITQDFEAPYFIKSLFKSPPEGISARFDKTVKPSKFFADSDIGIKLSTFTKGWDISLNYLYYYDDLPVFYNQLNTEDASSPFVQITPRFKRQHLLGGTFNKVIGSSTLRGEIAYIFNQNFTSNKADAKHGIEQSDVYKSAIGLDYIKGEYIVSAQLFTEWITKPIAPFNRDRFETNTSLQLSKEMMNDNLKAEVLWVHNSNHGDGFITPKLSYWLTTNTQLLMSSHLFYGNKNHLFGQFRDRSRLSFGFRWGI